MSAYDPIANIRQLQRIRSAAAAYIAKFSNFIKHPKAFHGCCEDWAIFSDDVIPAHASLKTAPVSEVVFLSRFEDTVIGEK
ncbi:MAG: hypothetical protein ACR2PC_10840 [Tsuneonella suprasediminis]|uniref:hypothetical protein n=1 Tax=Tsuneonella suprasediminis TaxID=2306996 RepID=UPI00105910CE|nr:hypothetical protein [Tsuneonella suprasediminis]UBS31690.1 hypothetical protein LBX01_09220 [Altererythrobacter sp. N1]